MSQEKKEINELKKLYDEIHLNVYSFLEYMKGNKYINEGWDNCGSIKSKTFNRCFFIERDMEMYKKSIDDLSDEEKYLQIKQKIGMELINADNKFIKDKLNEIDIEVNTLRKKWNQYKLSDVKNNYLELQLQ